MAGSRQAALVVILTSGLLSVATLAAAQTVPLPPPAPRGKSESRPVPPSSVEPQGRSSGSQSLGDSLKQWLPPIFGGEKEPEKKAQGQEPDKRNSQRSSQRSSQRNSSRPWRLSRASAAWSTKSAHT